MLHEDQSEVGLVGHELEKLREGVESSCRRSDSDHKDRRFFVGWGFQQGFWAFLDIASPLFLWKIRLLTFCHEERSCLLWFMLLLGGLCCSRALRRLLLDCPCGRKRA